MIRRFLRNLAYKMELFIDIIGSGEIDHTSILSTYDRYSCCVGIMFIMYKLMKLRDDNGMQQRMFLLFSRGDL